MDRTILEKRDRINEIARKYGARKIRVFGSQVRGEEHVDSDIDLLVEFEAPNLLDRIAMKNELEDELGLPVDLLTDESLHPLFALSQFQNSIRERLKI